MKIDVLCSDGSPLGVTSKTVYGDDYMVGVGGAELALLTMCELWTKKDYDVTLYNDPRELGASWFEQRPISKFNPNDPRDILITFRSTNPKSIVAKGYKVWWSCDQYTTGNFPEFAPHMNKIICISPYHQQYFSHTYGINNTVYIDLPVRSWDYEKKNEAKISNRLLFSSVPDRGLEVMRSAWDIIHGEVPDATLAITSDYRLWGAQVPANNERHRVRWIICDGVFFLGAVSRRRLIEEQLKAEILSYPCTYEELFCIACSEAQWAGAYPVTSPMGALGTTNLGTIIDSYTFGKDFVDAFSKEIIRLLTNKDELHKRQEDVMKRARERFAPEVIIDKWDKIFAEA